MSSLDVAPPLASGAPTFILPNPLTPLAFIPPGDANQLTISTYFFVAVTAIQIWDILCHLVDDYFLVRRHRIKFPMVIYCISRLASLAFFLELTIVNTAPIGHCAFPGQLISAFYIIAVPSSELLFFLHIRAVYIDNKAVVRFFMFMWIASVGGSVTPIIAGFTVTRPINIGVTEYCTILSALPAYTGASAIISGVNNTLLFFALAWRLQCCSYVDHGAVGNLKSIVLGQHLPRFAKSLFQHGQAYILSMMIINITTIILLYAESVPLAYRPILGFPCVMIMNVMAGRIYRNVKSGAINFPSLPNLPSHNLAFRRSGMSLPQTTYNIGITTSPATAVPNLDSKAVSTPFTVDETLGEKEQSEIVDHYPPSCATS